jgi:para-aminobenzoate synthetase / 4-amino-4-deoxychorismate lyase
MSINQPKIKENPTTKESTTPDFVLLESTKPGDPRESTFLFKDPVKTVQLAPGMATAEDLNFFFQRLTDLSKQYYLAGYLPYEIGYLLQSPYQFRHQVAISGCWFGVFTEPAVPDDKFYTLLSGSEEFSVNNIRPDITIGAYTDALRKIKRYIEEGDTYQVNYTTSLKFAFEGSPFALYSQLRRMQLTHYSALIHRDGRWILSLSPELFFKIENGVITTRPMKGTMPRGRTNTEDIDIAQTLAADPKNRAENLMIVDLMRNDIGRIAETGTVQVPSLFDVEKYRTVFQMTSTVMGRLRNDVTLFDLFKSLFPSGSVTGAPKLRTMEIIQELEISPRGVYTGAIGYISPYGTSVFNIPIRTIEIEGNTGTMGIGSGIVWDSEPEKEYEECLLKARFLTEPYKPVTLIESLRYENGYLRLDKHINRLLDSAAYFDIPIQRKKVVTLFDNYALNLQADNVYKVRLTLDESGEMKIDSSPIPATERESVTLRLSQTYISSGNRFLFHKTTNRERYTLEYDAAVKQGNFDVIFYNERGEITEGTITNIYIERDGMLITPPVSCGLLNGIYRRILLEEGKAQEALIHIDEFRNAGRIFVSNSVRGLLRATIAK